MRRTGLVVVAAWCLALAACGVKGPPKPPLEELKVPAPTPEPVDAGAR